jgi:tetratricopeptide (TPR) repeat protein
MRRALLALPLLLLAAQAPAPRAPEELDRAFAALRHAPDAHGAQLAEAAIRQLWGRQATPAVALLLNRGIRSLRAGQPGDALEDFDAAITLAPGLADAWYGRAQAYAGVGDPAAAARDLAEALRLEPRHWPSLASLSRLQEDRGEMTGAQRSHEAVLAIHPFIAGGQERLRELRRAAEGDDT